MKKSILTVMVFFMAFYAIAQDKGQQLIKAAKSNDVETIKKLLNEGVDANSTTEYGATALTFAGDKGHLEAVKILLENGADPNKKDKFYQSTPFTWCLYKDNPEIVIEMIKHGADVNNQSAAQWAASSGNKEIVKLMLEKGSKAGGTFLFSAVKDTSLEMVKLILDVAKLDKDALKSSLLLALALDYQEIAAYLKKNGAELPESSTEGEKLDLNTLTGNFKSTDGNLVKAEVVEGLLAIYFSGKAYKLMNTEGLKFQFIDFPHISITYNKAEDEVLGFDFKQGGYQMKYIKEQKGILENTKEDQTKTTIKDEAIQVEKPINWPSFRGKQASGIADGQYPPLVWDTKKGVNVKWKTFIPGLSHACPVIWDEKVFIITAMGSDSLSDYRVGLYGDVEPADDMSSHIWKIFCLNKTNGEIIWEKKAYEGIPRVKRHTKGTHANATPATNGKYVVALFGSEGLVCYNLDGKELWRKDLGKLDAGWFFDEETEWGPSSSPVIYRDYVIVQCDRSKDSYIAAFDLKTGKQAWNTPRKEISSWGTPTIYYGKERDELITHASKEIRAYDPNTGKVLWYLTPNSEVTVATPVVLDSLIYITAGYPPIRPVYAIKPGGNGDISIPDSLNSGEFIKWRHKRGGTYMPSPVAYKGYLYTLANNGTITCYDAITGEQKYRKPVHRGAFTASLLAADGKLYAFSEEDGVFVVKAGPEFELITSNPVDEILMSTPAISDGMIFIRGQKHLFCIGRE